MKQQIKRALTNNIGMKILALVFSFFLWLVVVNIDDPTQTRTFTAVVKVTNEDVLTDAGKIYEVKDGINTVSFRVTAKRSIIEKLSSSDFTAIADMNYLESEERVPVTITANSYASSVTISSKQLYLYVVLEDEATNRLVIDAKTTGEPADGVAIESVTCSPTVITVTGREDKVTSIVSVEAVCDISGVSADITESVIPVFYDGAGNVVDTTGLNLSVSMVDVSVDLVNLKAADISVKTSGSLAEGLSLESITTDPTTILLKGEPSVLNEVTGIVIPEGVINLSDVTSSFSTTVDITAYLPDGVSLSDSSQSTVTIYVTLEGEEAKNLEVTSSNISFTNLADGATAEIVTDPITTTVFGTTSALSSINGSSLVGYIDCNGLSNGEHSVVINFYSMEGITIQNVNVTVKISGAAEETDTTEDTGYFYRHIDILNCNSFHTIEIDYY